MAKPAPAEAGDCYSLAASMLPAWATSDRECAVYCGKALRSKRKAR